jgi:prepilin peptidase CpaA
MELLSAVKLITQFVCVALVVAAVIDVWKLKVPNLITFPLIVSGWIFWAVMGGWAGIGFSLVGTVVGLSLLLVPYAVGGMGAGDVKLLAGVGAWVGASTTFWAFCVSAMVGAVMAIAMMVWKRSYGKNSANLKQILFEFVYLRDISLIADSAAMRKSSMMLLPYGLPLAVGSIAYFFWMGMV